MISLDQVYLLEQKVESAVEKIQQLQAENDALRNKCNELTNALSAESEQLSTFESDQNQIESGIKKALDRLNSIENSVLKTASQMNQAAQAAKPEVQATPAPQAEAPKPVQSAPSFETMENVPVEGAAVTEKAAATPEQTLTENFVEDTFESEEEIEAPEDDNHDGLGFDIF